MTQDIYPDRHSVFDDSATKLSIIYNFFYPLYDTETALKTEASTEPICS